MCEIISLRAWLAIFGDESKLMTRCNDSLIDALMRTGRIPVRTLRHSCQGDACIPTPRGPIADGLAVMSKQEYRRGHSSDAAEALDLPMQSKKDAYSKVVRHHSRHKQ